MNNDERLCGEDFEVRPLALAFTGHWLLLAANSSLTSQVYRLKPVEINNEPVGIKSQIFIHVSISEATVAAELMKTTLCRTGWCF